MISDLDRSLEKLLQLEFGNPLPFDLSFEIPDKTFAPLTSSKNTLDCYLYDICEHRELRDPEPIVERAQDGSLAKRVRPARVKLSYCITAWSPSKLTPGIAQPLDEHRLLSDVLRMLLKYPTFPPAALVGLLVGQLPPLPSAVLATDPNRFSREFWNAIGGALRPALDYSVTLSLSYLPAIEGDAVKTVVSRYGEQPPIGVAEEALEFGGTVYDDAPAPGPITGAWVVIPELDRVTTTNDLGRFVFTRVPSGTYTLRVRAPGFQDGNRPVTVPAVSGDYDLALIHV